MGHAALGRSLQLRYVSALRRNGLANPGEMARRLLVEFEIGGGAVRVADNAANLAGLQKRRLLAFKPQVAQAPKLRLGSGLACDVTMRIFKTILIVVGLGYFLAGASAFAQGASGKSGGASNGHGSKTNSPSAGVQPKGNSGQATVVKPNQQIPDQIQSLLAQIQAARNKYFQDQKDLQNQMKNATEDQRDQLRNEMQDKREQFLEQQKELREEVVRRVDELKAQLREHQDLINNAQGPAPGKSRKGGGN